MEQKECSFDKIGCTRERKRKPLSFLLPFHSFALSLPKKLRIIAYADNRHI